MSRRLKWILGATGSVLLGLLLLLYTPPGLTLVGRLASPLTGGQVRITKLSGFFPAHLHVEALEVADADGVWLHIDNADLRWSALGLIRNHIAIDSVSASRIAVRRRPLPSKSSGGETPRVDIGQLSAPEVALGAPIIGHAVTLAVQGSDVHFVSIQDFAARLLVTRAGSSDRYQIDGGIQKGIAHGTVEIHEGADGIFGKLINLPGLGAVNLSAQASGDTRANTIGLRMSAGPLTAQGQGTIALATSRADIDITLASPAMRPRPDTTWQSLSGDVHVHGAFTTPQVQGHLLLADANIAGVKVQALTLDTQGDAGHVTLTGTAEKLAMPGDAGLLAKAPVQFSAQANLQNNTRPVRLSVKHPLMQLNATAQTAGQLHVTGDLTLPALAPFSALAKTALAGDAALHATIDQQDKQTKVDLNGALQLTGTALPARLLGKSQIGLTALLSGSDVLQSHLVLKGAALKAEAQGSLRDKKINYRLGLNLTDLSRLASSLQGALNLQATTTGTLDQAELAATGDALLATKGFARQRVTIALKAHGLPAVSGANLMVGGRLDGAPLSLRAAMTGDKTRHVTLTGQWRSLSSNADLTMAANGALKGSAKLALKQLADIAQFTGTKLSGAANAAVTLQDQHGKTGAAIDAALSNLGVAGATAQTVSLKGTIGDVTGKPHLDLTARANNVAAQGWKGDLQASAKGSIDKLDLLTEAVLRDTSNARANLHAAAALDLGHQQVTLTALSGDWRAVRLVLDAPTTVSFANGVALDRLAAHLGKGRMMLAGRVMPQLTLNASLDDIALADFAAFAPGVGPQGTLSATAQLHGTVAAPLGRVSLQGRGLRAAFSPGGMPPAAITLNAQLLGDHATLDASIDAGANAHMTLAGTAPLNPGGQMALHAVGKVDLALLDAVTAVSGRRIRGTVALEGDASGSPSAPRISGHGNLASGEFQDYAQSIRIQDIAASFSADGNRLILSQLTGRAGPGTLSGSGTVDLATADLPVEMKLQLQGARPITSDLMTADLSGAVTLSGHVKTAMTVTGNVQVTRATINVPQSFPPTVAILNVRHRGQPPAPPPAQQSRVNLDLTVRTIGPVFVRGHGMDADMGGNLRIGGTTSLPVVSGGLRMNWGTFSLAGQTLDFTSGQVRFDGSGLRGRLDPSLNFVAQTISGGVTATLTITGYASQPKIALTSTPELPQDEVVAHLLFQQNVKQLTPLQLASIAQAAAEMGGIGGGFNPLSSVRKTLGLDRLAVGSTQGGAGGTQSQTTVEAGRYVSRNVYVGVKQNLSGGTQTQVQVDITRRLKAQATLSTGASTTTVQGNALQDNGSSVGLSYQFQY